MRNHINSAKAYGFVLVVSLIGCFHLAACTFASRAVSERRSQTQEAIKRTPPKEEQVATLLRSEFGDLFILDGRDVSPSYMVGDFNGDGVEDIAISVRVNRVINPDDRSTPPFFFEKAFGPGTSTVGEEIEKDRFAIGALARYKDLTILLVIHGSSRQQWNNSEQKFVIVDAWHLGKKMMSLHQGRELKPSAYGDEPQIIPPPQLLGDAILMLDGESVGTAVYWDGARYRWYPVVAYDVVRAQVIPLIRNNV
jgi:hypothetical protein